MKKIKNIKTTTSTNKKYIVKNTKAFETDKDELELEPEYKHLMKISRILGIKV